MFCLFQADITTAMAIPTDPRTTTPSRRSPTAGRTPALRHRAPSNGATARTWASPTRIRTHTPRSCRATVGWAGTPWTWGTPNPCSKQRVCLGDTPPAGAWVLEEVGPVSPGRDPSSCGSFCWSCSPINPAKGSFPGLAMAGSLNSLILTKSPDVGASERISLRWITRSSREDYGTITIRISSTRRRGSDTYIASFVICRRY